MANTTLFKILNKTDEQPKRVELKVGAKFELSLPPSQDGAENTVSIDPVTGAMGMCLGEVICDCKEGYVFIDQEAYYEQAITELRINDLSIPLPDDLLLAGLVSGYFPSIVSMISPVEQFDLFEAVTKIRPGLIKKSPGGMTKALASISLEAVPLYISVVNPSGGAPIVIVDKVLCPIDCDVSNRFEANLPDVTVSPNLFLTIGGVTISNPTISEVYPKMRWYEAMNDLIYRQFDNDAPIDAYEDDGERGIIENLTSACVDVQFYTVEDGERIDIIRTKIGFMRDIPQS